MTALIAATKSLLGQLQAAASVNGDVYVSIIPFVKDVNLDPSNWNSDYIYWGTTTGFATGPERYPTTVPGTQIMEHALPGITRPAAHASSTGPARYRANSQSQCASAGTCSDSTYTTQSTCTGAGTCSISSKTSRRAPAPARALARYLAKPRRTPAPARALARYPAKTRRALAPARALARYRTKPRRTAALARTEPGHPERGRQACGRQACGQPPRERGRQRSGPIQPGHPKTTTRGLVVSWTAAIQPLPSYLTLSGSI